MYKIHYGGAVFITGDDIADAVMSYAGALAERGTCAECVVPMMTGDAQPATVTFLIGAGYPIAAESLPASTGVELADDGLVASLHYATERIRHPAPVGVQVPVLEPAELGLYEY